jgi:hypothetical protein
MYSITVNITPNGEKIDMSVSFPKDQIKLSVKENAHILTSAISLLIRTCSTNDTGITESALLREVIKHLEEEFICDKSFNDAALNKEVFNLNNKNHGN